MRSSLLLALLVPLAGPAQGASQLKGRVIDDAGAPIAGATVTITGVGYSVRSDSSGTFLLAGTPGSTLKLSLRAPGYRDDTASVVLARGKMVDKDFTLHSADFVPPEANPSDRVLRGRVFDTDGQPLSYANVQINYGRRFVSDDSGRFQVPVHVTGSMTVLVRRIGFEPTEIRLAGMPDTALNVRLTAIPIQLRGVVVTGASAYRSLDIHGFYGRMRDADRGINHGYFVTPEDLERRKPNWISQMAEGFPTVSIRRGMFPKDDVIIGARGCTMTVYLDNVRIVGRLRGIDDKVNEMAAPTHVAAMEIYPRAIGAPSQYQSNNGTCGVVLIWTK